MYLQLAKKHHDSKEQIVKVQYHLMYSTLIEHCEPQHSQGQQSYGPTKEYKLRYESELSFPLFSFLLFDRPHWQPSHMIVISSIFTSILPYITVIFLRIALPL